MSSARNDKSLRDRLLQADNIESGRLSEEDRQKFQEMIHREQRGLERSRRLVYGLWGAFFALVIFNFIWLVSLLPKADVFLESPHNLQIVALIQAFYFLIVLLVLAYAILCSMRLGWRRKSLDQEQVLVHMMQIERQLDERGS